MNRVSMAVSVAGLAMCASAMADYTITQGSSAATYSQTLNFDEVGGPNGFGLPTDAWTAYGITELLAGDGNQVVSDFTGNPGQSWLGTGNSFYGNFGVFAKFDSDLTALSMQVWDPSGPPTFTGGGLNFILFNDGVQVDNLFTTPAWGGIGDTWFDAVATGGMVFDEVRILGFGFNPTTYVDNLSWTKIPSPASAAILGCGALMAGRRRR